MKLIHQLECGVFVCSVYVILLTSAAPLIRQERSVTKLLNDIKTLESRIAVLDRVLQYFKYRQTISSKRQVDAGYGSRNSAASQVGSKLVALYKAKNIYGPGRRKRATIEKSRNIT